MILEVGLGIAHEVGLAEKARPLDSGLEDARDPARVTWLYVFAMGAGVGVGRVQGLRLADLDGEDFHAH